MDILYYSCCLGQAFAHVVRLGGREGSVRRADRRPARPAGGGVPPDHRQPAPEGSGGPEARRVLRGADGRLGAFALERPRKSESARLGLERRRAPAHAPGARGRDDARRDQVARHADAHAARRRRRSTRVGRPAGLGGRVWAAWRLAGPAVRPFVQVAPVQRAGSASQSQVAPRYAGIATCCSSYLIVYYSM